jgi:hypothetical protein
MSEHVDTPLPNHILACVEVFQPGIYRHTKTGGLYAALGLITHHHTRLPMVKYVSLTTGEENVRPLIGWDGDDSGWANMIEHGGSLVNRFTFVCYAPMRSTP